MLLRRSVISGAGYRGYSATDLSIFAAKTAAHQEYTDIGFHIKNLGFLENDCGHKIVSDPPFVEWHFLFTTVPVKPCIVTETKVLFGILLDPVTH